MLVTALCRFTGREIPRTMVVREALLGRNDAGEFVPLERL